MVLDEKKIERFRKFLDKPRTMHELMGYADVSRRTVFRWFEVLELNLRQRVVRVDTRRPTRYQIVRRP